MILSILYGRQGFSRVGKSRLQEPNKSLAVLDPITSEKRHGTSPYGNTEYGVRSTPLAVDRFHQLRVSPWEFEALARDLMTVFLKLRGLRAELNCFQLSMTALPVALHPTLAPSGFLHASPRYPVDGRGRGSSNGTKPGVGTVPLHQP